MVKLSAIIIARNEEKDIERCLRSLAGLADEIVLIDDFSTDKTAEIARKYPVKIIQNKFESYGAQKQFALDKAQGRWIINIDADEELGGELKNEISSILDDGTEYSGFEMPFRVFFLGRRLRFGRGAREHHIRLFRKEKASYAGGTVHEGIKVEGSIGRLKNFVNHYTYSDLDEYFEKFNRYTSMIARKKFEAGKRFNIFQLARLQWEFIVRYFVKLGFLDGWYGFLYAWLSSYYVLFKYLKLWDLERKKNVD